MSNKFLGPEAACGANVGAASTFLGALDVRLVNSGTTARLVTIANSADVTLAPFTLVGGEVSFVRKNSCESLSLSCHHHELIKESVDYFKEGNWPDRNNTSSSAQEAKL